MMNRFTSRDSRGFTLIAMPMILGQREKAKDSAVKGGTHNIELGVASIAVDHGDTYPAAVADKTGLVDAGGRGLTLAGHMNDGDFVVP